MRESLWVVALATWFVSQATAQTPWTVPRLPNGQPDLQGTWENNSATPLDRPLELAGKPLLSEEEVAAMEARAVQLFGPDADAVEQGPDRPWAVREPESMAGQGLRCNAVRYLPAKACVAGFG